jgi:hypothetical protein
MTRADGRARPTWRETDAFDGNVPALNGCPLRKAVVRSKGDIINLRRFEPCKILHERALMACAPHVHRTPRTALPGQLVQPPPLCLSLISLLLAIVNIELRPIF